MIQNNKYRQAAQLRKQLPRNYAQTWRCPYMHLGSSSLKRFFFLTSSEFRTASQHSNASPGYGHWHINCPQKSKLSWKMCKACGWLACFAIYLNLLYFFEAGTDKNRSRCCTSAQEGCSNFKIQITCVQAYNYPTAHPALRYSLSLALPFGNCSMSEILQATF